MKYICLHACHVTINTNQRTANVLLNYELFSSSGKYSSARFGEPSMQPNYFWTLLQISGPYAFPNLTLSIEFATDYFKPKRPGFTDRA